MANHSHRTSAVRLFNNRSQKTSKCGKNISDTLGYRLVRHFLFLPHFNVICDLLGSLSTRVFETRTATGSELFSLLTCPHTTTFTLLSMFSPLEMNSIKIWETIRSKNANCSLPVAVRVSKTRVLKLPNTEQTRARQHGIYLLTSVADICCNTQCRQFAPGFKRHLQIRIHY